MSRAAARSTGHSRVLPAPAVRAAATALFVVSAAGLVAVSLRAPGRVWTDEDFRVYWLYGRALLSGHALYEPVAGTHLPFTYPPFAALALLPVTALPYRAGTIVMGVVSVAALVAVVRRALDWTVVPPPARAATALVVAGLALWLEPVQATLFLGQINLLVCLLVVADLLRGPGGRAAGVGIGLAAGLKLTPALFIVGLLVTGQRRAARTAAATFAATVLLGLAADPREAWRYWDGGFAGASIRRIASPSFVSNQSLWALAVRTLGRDGGVGVALLWLVLAVPVAGLALAVARRASPLLALAAVAVGMLLLSPVSWSHHYVWVVPVLIALADAAVRRGVLSTGWGRAVAAVGAAVAVACFGAWPGAKNGAAQPTGLIWHQPWASSPAGGRPEYHWTALQELAGNAYLIAGVLALAAAAWLTRPAGAATARTMPVSAGPDRAASCS